MNLNQKGFTLVEGLLVAVLISVIGFAGFYVWDRNRNDSSNELTTVEGNQEDLKETSPESNNDEYFGWKTYSSVRDGYSIKYPSDWVVIEESNDDGPYIRNFDPSTKPDATRQEGSGYPEGYINLRVLVQSDDNNFPFGHDGLNLSEWYDNLGVNAVSNGPVVYIPDDVRNVLVAGKEAKSAKSAFTEIDENIYILEGNKLYNLSIFPYGISSEPTVKLMLDSFIIK